MSKAHHRNKPEDALGEGEGFFRSLLRSVPDVVAVVDADGALRYVSPAVEAMLGCAAEEIINTEVFDYVHPDDVERMRGSLAEALKSPGVLPPVGIRVRRADGSWRRVEVARDNRLDDPSVAGVVVTLRDVTGRKGAEEQLAGSEGGVRPLVRNSSDVITVLDADGTIVYDSPAVERVLGYKPEERVGTVAFDQAHPSDRERGKRVFEALLASPGAHLTHEFLWPRKDGAFLWLEVTLTNLLDDPAVRGIVCDWRNITERKKAEEDLRLKDRAISATSDGIIITDPRAPDDPIVYVNGAFERITGYSAEEAIGRNCRFLQDDDRDQPVLQGLRDATREGREFRGVLRNYRKDGTSFFNELHLAPVRDGDGRLVNFVGVQTDVTARMEAEEAVRKGEARLAEAQRLAHLGGWEWDVQTDEVSWSDEVYRIYGLAPQSFAPSLDRFMELVHPDDRNRVRKTIDEALDGSGPYDVEHRVVRPDGEVRAVHRRAEVVRDEGGEPLRMIGTVHDVTERKRAEEALRESEEKYRTLVEAVQEGIGFVDAEERITYCNRAYADIFEATPQGLVGRTLLEFLDDQQREKVLEQTALRKNNIASAYELVVTAEDGSSKIVSATGSPIMDADGEFRGSVHTMIDVTERKRAEEALRESEERYRAVVERTTDGVFLGDFSTNRILESNAALQNMLGYSAEELRGKSLYELVVADPASIDRNTRRIREGKSILIGERRYRRKDGSVVDVETSGTVIPYGDMEVSCCIARDVTERKRAEDALREAEERYRTLVEQLPAITYVEALDEGERATGINYVSPQVEKILGYSVEEWSSDPGLWARRLHPDDRERVLEEDARTEDTGEPFSAEYRLIARDGSVVWAQDQAALVRSEDGRPRYWQGFMLDVTKRKEAEENLRRSEERFRSLVQHSSDIIIVLGADGTIRYVSPAMERILGFGPEERVGTNILDHVHADDVKWVRAKLNRVLEHKEARSSMWYRVRDKRGSWHHFEALATNLLDSPSVGGLVLNSRDITERKRAEELQSRLARQAELRADVSSALAESGALSGILQRCTEAVVRNLDAAFARIWTLNEEENVLELQASAGMYTHLDGAHSRVPVGSFKIGLIAQEQQPHLTNTVTSDPRVSDKEWARREGMVAFAGYPLVVENRLVGVMAMFSREALAEETVETLGSVADMIAQGIERRRIEEALRRSRASLAEAQRIAHIGNWEYEVEGDRAHWSDEMYRIFSVSPGEFVPTYKTFLRLVHPDDREFIRRTIREALFGGERRSIEYRIVRPNGVVRSAHTEYEVLRDGSGNPNRLVGTVHDVTERKRAEVELQRNLQRLSALNEASRLLGSTLELDEIGRSLLETTQHVAPLAAAAIFLQDEGGKVRVGYTLGPEDALREVTAAPAARAARRGALASTQPQSFRPEPPDPDGAPVMGLCVPLRARGRTIGVLEAFGPESLSEEATVDTIAGLANQAAGALENARLYAELGDRENRLRELVGRLIMAQEEERRRVAREVHDGLTQMLVAAHQHLQAFAEYHPPDDPEGRADLGWVLEVVQQTVGEARRVIADLRPTALDDFGLATAIRLQAQALRDEGWEVDYEETLGEERLPVAMETALFRVAQEALTNARKHAGTKRVGIALERLEHAVRIRIRDWGRGFSPTALTNGGAPGERVGLSSMRERVALFGGSLEIESSPGAGTSLVAKVPLAQKGNVSEGA